MPYALVSPSLLDRWRHVTAYDDDAFGQMSEQLDGSGQFISVCLRPSVTIADASSAQRALFLHEKAQEFCFISKSVNFPVTLEPQIVVQTVL